MRRRRSPALLVLAAALLLAVAAACASKADSSRLGAGEPATTATTTPCQGKGTGKASGKDTLDWKSCSLGAECAVLAVRASRDG